MLLTITTTHHPATDIGYLLHKNPQSLHTAALSFGNAYVFYPEATSEQCTAALLLDIDPIALVRKKESGHQPWALQDYVNDRPYAASSLMSVALAQIFRTAFSGKCNARPTLVDEPIPLDVTVNALPCRGDKSLFKRLFEPLGYTVTITDSVLDEQFTSWGNSNYYTLRLQNTIPLRDLLAHLYVLIPVFDNEKHYWVGDDEVTKLLHRGEGWLSTHPEKNLITNRYLKHLPSLIHPALKQLSFDETEQTTVDTDGQKYNQEDALEKPLKLNDQRMAWVVEKLKQHNIARVIDLGCGEGTLLSLLQADRSFTQIAGCDVSSTSLERAKKRLHLDSLPTAQQERFILFQSALTYSDKRLSGYQAATLIEVIEHIDESRLEALTHSLLSVARPDLLLITTPNAEYNALFEQLKNNSFRHHDHRFEWTRAEFQSWAHQVADRYGYQVSFDGIGEHHEQFGAPTQAGVFIKHG